MTMQRAPLLSLLAFIAVLAAGCVQSSAPQQCTGLPQAQADSCTYQQAVLEQNPFYCYSIGEIESRSECMRHASDPAMKKRLENFRGQPEQPQQQSAAPLPPPPPPAEAETGCGGLSGIPRDDCLLNASVSQNDIAGCTLIADASAKQVCISRVARATKDVSSCDSLADQDDAELCRLYAGGENP